MLHFKKKRLTNQGNNFGCSHRSFTNQSIKVCVGHLLSKYLVQNIYITISLTSCHQISLGQTGRMLKKWCPYSFWWTNISIVLKVENNLKIYFCNELVIFRLPFPLSDLHLDFFHFLQVMSSKCHFSLSLWVFYY